MPGGGVFPRAIPRDPRSGIGAALLLAISALGPLPALAHHGKDFLVAETADVPSPGIVYFICDLDHVAPGGEPSGTEASPALLAGATSWMALELHAHAAKVGGESWSYEATAPGLHFRVIPPGRLGAWSLGLSAEYELARDREEPDRAEARLIATWQRDATNFTANLTVARDRPSSEGTAWGYAIAFRPRLDRTLGWGVEAQGLLQRGAAQEILAGFYAEPTASVTVKAGVGALVGAASGGWTGRIAVILRF